MRTIEDSELKQFIEDDFYNTLRWLFEGAIGWEATFRREERTRHQRVLGMFTTFVQARALYEFFYTPGKNDDSRLVHFSTWAPARTLLYDRYMAHLKPANKLIFHLVYGRSAQAGGSESVGDRLEDKVLDVALDLYHLCSQFAENLAADSVCDAVSRRAIRSDRAGHRLVGWHPSGDAASEGWYIFPRACAKAVTSASRLEVEL